MALFQRSNKLPCGLADLCIPHGPMGRNVGSVRLRCWIRLCNVADWSSRPRKLAARSAVSTRRAGLRRSSAGRPRLPGYAGAAQPSRPGAAFQPRHSGSWSRWARPGQPSSSDRLGLASQEQDIRQCNLGVAGTARDDRDSRQCADRRETAHGGYCCRTAGFGCPLSFWPRRRSGNVATSGHLATTGNGRAGVWARPALAVSLLVSGTRFPLQ